MRFSIKTKQVVGVVLLVALAVTALSAIYTALVAGVLLTETQSRGEMPVSYTHLTLPTIYSV